MTILSVEQSQNATFTSTKFQELLDESPDEEPEYPEYDDFSFSY